MKFIAFRLSIFVLALIALAATALGQTTTLTINSSTGLVNVPEGVTPNFAALKVGNVTIGSAATHAASDFVSSTITINGHATTGSITITAADVSAVPTSRQVNGHGLASDITLTLPDVITLPGDATKFLNGTGNFSTPAGGGGGGGVTRYTVTDDAARFAGTYSNGDLVKEIGQPAIFTLQVGDDSGGSADMSTVTFQDGYGNTFGVWLNINGDGPPSGWAYGAYQIQVSASQNDTAATIGANVLAALNANIYFTSEFSASFDGVNTLTITALSNFVFVAGYNVGTSVWGYNVTQNGEAPTHTFIVIDSANTGSEDGFAPLN